MWALFGIKKAEMNIWILIGYTIISSIFSRADQPKPQAGDCEFDEDNDRGTFSGLSPANATEIFYSTRRKTYECRWHILVPWGFVYLTFEKFKFTGIWPSCNYGSNLTIYDFSRERDYIYNVTYCGEKLPPVFHSWGQEVDVVVKGSLEAFILRQDLHHLGEFQISYNVMNNAPEKDRGCGKCGADLFADSGRLSSPAFPNRYLSNCDCTWRVTVKKGYFIKFHFLSFILEEKKDSLCYDYVTIFDGGSLKSPVLGHFCGVKTPVDLKTSGSKAVIHFFSDFSRNSRGFNLIYEAVKDERDLSGLRSIAAILGGVSFGIFVFLLLCSVLYKRYVGDQQTPTAGGEHGDDQGDDFIDAVQAGAPPSYQIVMAAPNMYPRTPEISPSGSPQGSPSGSPPPSRRRRPPALHHTADGIYVAADGTNIDVSDLPLTPPPPYSSIVRDNQISFDDYPPPPSYDILSNSLDTDNPFNCDTAERQPLSQAEGDRDTTSLLQPAGASSRSARSDGSIPQIGRLILPDAVTSRRNRELQGSRNSEHASGAGVSSSNKRRFPGSKSLSNFLQSASLREVRRQASDANIWSRRSRQCRREQFANDLALSLSALRSRCESDAMDTTSSRHETRFVIDEDDISHGAQVPDHSEVVTGMLPTEDADMSTSNSFDRFTLSRHQHSYDMPSDRPSDLHSLCSESVGSMDRLSTRSDSSRQYLVNLSGRLQNGQRTRFGSGKKSSSRSGINDFHV